MAEPKPGAHEVRRLFGDMSDHRITEILATGASLSDMQAVAIWLAGADDILGDERRPLDGTAGRVCEIVARDDAWNDAEDQPR